MDPVPRPGRSLTDLLWRTAYRIAFAGLRLWWWLARPTATGAHVAVWCGPRLLLLRNSYRPTLAVPGGGVGSREDPAAAARRELCEETGIRVDPAQMVYVGRIDCRHDHLLDLCHFFELRVEDPPELCIDGREVVWAGWVDPAELGDQPLHTPTREYLARGGFLDPGG